MKKLAIITSHPIQYYAPWFQSLAQAVNLDVRVFYLWQVETQQSFDPDFRQSIQWDIPLLTGYDFEFVVNTSSKPGTSNFWGLQNPSLSQQVAAYQPDVVLCMIYNYASLYRFLLTWRRCPLLFRGDSHRLVPAQGLKAQAKRAWISQIYRQFSACLYVGKANYQYFRFHGVPEQRLFFAPHSVDNDRFMRFAPTAVEQAQHWKQELGIPDAHRVILFAGKFIAKKRPLDLLQAYLQAQLSDVALLFVGSGELEPQMRSLAQNHPHVYFAPFQNQSQMPRTLAIADVVVLPSYGSGETWGLIINEAMCLGKPVIVSTHVGCAEDLVDPGQNGLIFPAGDVQALSTSLQMAFRDRNLLQSWGSASRERISHYSYAHTTQGLIQAMQMISIVREGR